MKLRRFSLEFRLRALLAAAFIGLSGHAAYAGWVIESETITPAPVPIKTDKDGNTFAGKPAPAPVKNYTMWLQDGNIRVDLAHITMIVDKKSDQQFLILHNESQYSLMPGESTRKAQPLDQKPEQPERVKPVSTGKTQTINGYETQAWEAVLPDRKVTFWVTQDGENAKQLRDAILDAYSRMLMAALDDSIDIKALPGYPIQTIVEANPKKTTLKNRAVIATPGRKTTHTVTSIKSEPIDAGKFKVPADYKAMSLLPRHEPKPADKPAETQNAQPADK